MGINFGKNCKNLSNFKKSSLLLDIQQIQQTNYKQIVIMSKYVGFYQNRESYGSRVKGFSFRVVLYMQGPRFWSYWSYSAKASEPRGAGGGGDGGLAPPHFFCKVKPNH